MFYRIMLTIVVVQFYVQASLARKVPCVFDVNNRPLCYCNKHGETDCSNQRLYKIPDNLPNTTISLNMNKNYLTFLSSDMLTDTIKDRLEKLFIAKNLISVIEKAFFGNFKSLKTLDLTLNPIVPSVLRSSFINMSENISTLYLNKLHLREGMSEDVFEPLNGSALTTLELTNNKLKEFTAEKLFMYLPNLTFLDLSYNYIASLHLSQSNSLEHLYLSRNDLTRLPLLCPNSSLFPNLRSLTIDHNCISVLQMTNLNCLHRLETFNISATRLETLENNTFSNLPSLKTVSVEHLESLVYLEPYAFNSSSLRAVYMRDNKLQFCKPYVNVSSVFGGCSNLKILDISSNFVGKLRNRDWEIMLSKMTKLEYLDISQSKLLFLPVAIPKVLPNLRQLRVSNNYVHKIPNGYFDNMNKLSQLFLNGNKLTKLERQQLPTTRVEHLNLAYNPFVCDCNILWFLKYLKFQHSIHVLAYYPEHYVCANRPIELVNVTINIKNCLIRQTTGFIINCTCVSVTILLVIFSAVFRYRWRLRYLIHILNFNRRKYTRVHCNTYNLPTDVYFSCSKQDFDFVHSNIVKKMEGDGFTAFIAERDALPGSMKITNTLEKMDECKYVLLCLSNSFAQDHWCEYETCMAIERSVYEGRRVIILLLLEEISSVNVTNFIHKLMTTNDYIKWGRNEEARDLFWRRFRSLIENDESTMGGMPLLRSVSL